MMATINGTSANDLLNSTTGDDVIDGLAGVDILSYLSATSAVTVDARITGAQNTLGGGVDSIIGIEQIGGSIYNDTLIGGGTVNVLYGAAGNDTLTSATGLEITDTYGGDGDDTINLGAATFRAYSLGGKGNDTFNGSSADDTIYGDNFNDVVADGGNDVINGNAGVDYLYGEAGNDSLNGGTGNDLIDGGVGTDIAIFNANTSSITEMRHLKAGGGYIVSSDGTDVIFNLESLQFLDGTITGGASGDVIKEFLTTRTIPTFSGATNPVTRYAGAVTYLEYENFGTNNGDVVTGSTGNDFINLFGGDDAANGGLGDDVLDGGVGSNFLTGGGGTDTFFLDGRGGTNTWATITDFNAGDQVNIWGWALGTSKLLLTQTNAGAAGFEGATYHYDLNNDNTIDTSITFTGLTTSQITSINPFAGVLIIG